jgi:hypothetical protein
MEKRKDAKETAELTYPPYTLHFLRSSSWEFQIPLASKTSMPLSVGRNGGDQRWTKMMKIEAAGMRVATQNFCRHYDQSRTAHFPVLVEEASSRQSLFCKIGTFSCGVIFCRDNRDVRKLTNTSGLGNLDASSARQTFAVQKPDNQDRATAVSIRSVLFPADLTYLVSWIVGQGTEYPGGFTQFVASSRAALAKPVFQTQ